MAGGSLTRSPCFPARGGPTVDSPGLLRARSELESNVRDLPVDDLHASLLAGPDRVILGVIHRFHHGLLVLSPPGGSSNRAVRDGIDQLNKSTRSIADIDKIVNLVH